MRLAMEDLFYEHGVDLVLAGHVHGTFPVCRNLDQLPFHSAALSRACSLLQLSYANGLARSK